MICRGHIKLTLPVSVIEERRPPKLPVDHRDEVVYLFSDGERRYYAGWRGFYYMTVGDNVFRISEYKGIRSGEREDEVEFAPLNWWYYILPPDYYVEIKKLHLKGKKWHVPYVRDLLSHILYGYPHYFPWEYQRYVVSYELYHGVDIPACRFEFAPLDAVCGDVVLYTKDGSRIYNLRYMFRDTFTGENYYVKTDCGFVIEYDEESCDGRRERILWLADVIGDRTWRDAITRSCRQKVDRANRRWVAAVSAETAIWVTENMITGLYQLD